MPLPTRPPLVHAALAALAVVGVAAAEPAAGESDAGGTSTTITLPDGTIKTTTVKTYADGSREERVVTRTPAGATQSAVVTKPPATAKQPAPARSGIAVPHVTDKRIDTGGFGLAFWRSIDDRRDGPPGSYATGVGVGLAAWDEFRLGAQYWWGRDWGEGLRAGQITARIQPDPDLRIDASAICQFDHAAGLMDWSVKVEAGFRMDMVEPVWRVEHQDIGAGDIDAFGPGLRVHLGTGSRIEAAWITQTHRGGTEEHLDLRARATFDWAQIRAGFTTGTAVAPREASAHVTALSGGVQLWDLLSVDATTTNRAGRYAGYAVTFGMYSVL
jgi:hypothetical protein